MRSHGLTSEPRAGGEAGISLIELLIANIVMVFAVLSFVHTIGVSNKLNRATQEKALATVTLSRFVERLRADTSWSTLYTRLRQKSVENAKDTGLTQLKVDLTLPTYPITTYYSDLTIPASLGTVTFLVQVPVATVNGQPSLVENVVAPRYGLPHDLNSDGKIDAAAHTDNTALPIVARLRWTRSGQQPHEVVLATWLRGGS
jgi:Tfp pilus assembly protein PilE